MVKKTTKTVNVKKPATKTKKTKESNVTKAKKRVTKKKVFTKAADDKLFNLLKDINKEVFAHHVNDDKNDFANWIRDVFDEPELAKKVSTKKNPKDIQITIYKYVITKHLH